MNIKLYAAIALTALALSACKQDSAPAADAASDTAPTTADPVAPPMAGTDGSTEEQVAPLPAGDAPPVDPAETQAAVEAAADEAAKMVETQSAEAADKQ